MVYHREEVLRQTLFVTLSNDIIENIAILGVSTILFVDGMKLYACSESSHHLQDVNNELTHCCDR